MREPVDVIIPAYNGLADLRRCVDSVLTASVSLPHQLIVIDDASPDAAVGDYLRELGRRQPGIQILSNPHNLGFVGTVNRGMSLHPARDVVLLNSDTRVANDWLGRLQACAYSEPTIGTATPFSNNATICSFPRSCELNELPAGWTVADLDRVFSQVNAGARVGLPTGIGFCMYIKRECLHQVGGFDQETFGRGYGEENDFCMRAQRLGWRDVLCADTYVYHAGGGSFGLEKQALEQAAIAVLAQRYPDYQTLVLRHIEEDPARPLRLRVQLELVRQGPGRRVLYICHGLGGGTERHLVDLAARLGEQLAPLVLRPEGGGVRLGLGIGAGDPALGFRLPDDAEVLVEALRYLAIERVHFHHTMGLNPWVWGLPERLGVPFDLTLHDYYLINANPTLIGEDATYCDDPETRDEHCVLAYPLPGGVDAATWRRNQEVLLYGADRVIAPSHFTAGLYRHYFPRLQPTVAAHPDWEGDWPYPTPRALAVNGVLKVAVLGAISREKGADLLEATALHCRTRGIPVSFTLIGYAYRPLDGVVAQWGPYRDPELAALLNDAEPHVVWFPACWPETYSYTLSTVLNAALPVVAPNIGAFPERLRGRPLSWVEPWDRGAEDWVQFFAALPERLRDAAAAESRPWTSAGPGSAAFRYSDHYLEPITPKTVPSQQLELAAALALRGVRAAASGAPLTGRERLLSALVRLRQLPMLAGVARIVPYAVQRRVKRWLSARPIHDIVSGR